MMAMPAKRFTCRPWTYSGSEAVGSTQPFRVAMIGLSAADCAGVMRLILEQGTRHNVHLRDIPMRVQASQ